MIDAHRLVTILSRDRMSLTLEEFFVLWLFRTKNYRDMYRFAFEVPSSKDPNKGVITTQLMEGLVDKGYLKVVDAGQEVITDKYEMVDDIFADQLIDSLEVAREIFAMWTPIMQFPDGRMFTSRTISFDDFHKIIKETIGFNTRAVTPNYIRTKGKERMAKLLTEENLRYIDKVKYIEMRDNVKSFLESVKQKKVNPIGMEKYFLARLWEANTDTESQKNKPNKADHSEDI